MNQYEIWWADLPKPAGRRPVLLLTRAGGYGVLKKFIAAEITTTVRRIPVELPLGAAEGMPLDCVVNFDNLRTIPKSQLAEKIGKIATSRILEVKHAAGYALGWAELIDAE